MSDNRRTVYGRYGYRPNGSGFINDDPKLLVEQAGISRLLFDRYASAPLPCDGSGVCSPHYDFLYDGAAITEGGTAVFGAQVNGVGVTTLNNDAVFQSVGESTIARVRDGDAAWGLPSGYRFSHISNPHVFPNGELLFPSYIATPSGDVELKYSLFADTGGSERLVARYGAPARGYPASRTIGNLLHYFATETGQPVVIAEIDGGVDDVAIYREEQNELTLVAQNGQVASGIPGADLGVRGSLLFESPVTGSSVLKAYWYVPTSGRGGEGLWQMSPQGTFGLLLHEGQNYALAPDDVRIISYFRPLGFTSDGALPIELQFSDSSRALISWSDTPQRMAGDANGDGDVDAADYVLWRKNVGQSVLGGYGADADGDRIIGEGDFRVWKTNFGRASAENSLLAVPEPGALVLVSIALAGCLKRRLTC